jgi:murein DD-endopeptidase MepM/ murein hydrolase activator NlpD
MKLFVLGVFCLGVSAQWVGANEDFLQVTLRTQEASQGGILGVNVKAPGLVEVTGRVSDQKIPFFNTADGRYLGLVGIDMEQKSGRVPLVIQGRELSGAIHQSVVDLRIKRTRFPEERFSVPPGFDQLDDTTLQRIRVESERLNRLWTSATPERLWEGPFILPVAGDGAVSSPFGLRRIINGLARSPHSGVDLKARLGTDVLAANHGKVVVRDEFFFGGKTVVLDHGAGLYTMYFHLDDFQVADGMGVRKGEVIGKVGMTGRVTGPHLHWGVRLQRARVDPMDLLKVTQIHP